MTLNEARITAVNNSLRHGGAVQHINTTLHIQNKGYGNERYIVNQAGYTVSSWSCDATVESYRGQTRTYSL
jgi:hypothetical protein